MPPSQVSTSCHRSLHALLPALVLCTCTCFLSSIQPHMQKRL
jgi:hypothetical protein